MWAWKSPEDLSITITMINNQLHLFLNIFFWFQIFPNDSPQFR